MIVAIGAHNPRTLSFPGSEHTVSALDFLTSANAGQPMVERGGQIAWSSSARATWAWTCAAWRGSWGRRASPPWTFRSRPAPAASATPRSRWAPKSSGRALSANIRDGQLFFEEGEPLPADVVIVSIGEVPITDWLPENLPRVKDHWLAVDEFGRTRDPKVFAVGDVVKPGLLTEAIGGGRIAALALHAQVMGEAIRIAAQASHSPGTLEPDLFHAAPESMPHRSALRSRPVHLVRHLP